jgi:hypothetical protein
MSTTVAPRYAKRAAIQVGATSAGSELRRDQNSAGRYPLISSPMQISTRVGVVQAIGRLPYRSRVPTKLDRGGRLRKPGNRTGGHPHLLAKGIPLQSPRGAPSDNPSGISLRQSPQIISRFGENIRLSSDVANPLSKSQH